MRFRGVAFLCASVVLALLVAVPARAGMFGNSELGIIKQSANVYRFIAPDGETINDDSLLFNAARTAKLLGYTHFLFVRPKDPPKPKAAKNSAADAPVDIVEEPKPLTSVLVYFFNGPRKQFGVSTLAVTDVFPEDDAPAVVETPPQPKPKPKVVEPAAEATPKKVEKKKPEPVVEPAPVVEEAPAPKPEAKKVEKKKPEPVVEPAPVVVEEAPAPAPEVNKNLSIGDALGVKSKKPKSGMEVAPPSEASSETANSTIADPAAPQTQVIKKKKRIILEEEIKKPEVGDKFE